MSPFALEQPCRFCGRLAKEAICPACRSHREESGHFPGEVRLRQVPGQPRALVRFCGKCGRELEGGG